MIRSMFAGLSGVICHQTRMDVIGNNLSNVNTVGFKERRTSFQDALYQTMESGSSPQEGGLGGTNPKQVGLGVSLASIDVIHTQGSLERTGQPLDLAIDGDGMFILSDGNGVFFSRDGSFRLDSRNNLVSAGTGLHVQGWSAQDGVVDAVGTPTDLVIPYKQAVPARATTVMNVVGNLDGSADVYAAGPPPTGGHHLTDIDIFDSLGNNHRVQIEFVKTAIAPNSTWDWTATENGVNIGSGTIEFDPQGRLIPPATQPSVTLNINNGAATPQTVDIDFSLVTQFAGDYTAVVQSQDGFPSGIVDSISIDHSGLIIGALSNGNSITLGQIALASFPNVAGLERVGSNLYVAAPNAGLAQMIAPGSGGTGTIASGALELSNVDLTKAFVDMIITQRGFQASSRVIAVSNQILQDVFQMINV